MREVRSASAPALDTAEERAARARVQAMGCITRLHLMTSDAVDDDL